jgi:hypothetical protein
MFRRLRAAHASVVPAARNHEEVMLRIFQRPRLFHMVAANILFVSGSWMARTRMNW